MTNPSLVVRLLAIVYETLVIGALIMLYAFAAEALMVLLQLTPAPSAELHDATYSQHPLYFVGLFTFIWLYFAFFWRRSGQTVAMQAWRLKLTNARGDSRPTWLQTFIRFLAAIVSLLLLGSGYLIALLRSDKKTLPDLLSDTELVRLEKKPKL
ncbi:RDD family protein [Salinibius halmophilus]|uniref:RDD family protein n=1 Tax=Salinibius halmophilus TaxID=1853216 RepID=UPI001314CE0C|nr:RDD family protein [Salinibius halmophilus]